MNRDQTVSRKTKNPPSKVRKTAYAAATVIFLFAGAEIGLRIFGFEHDPGPRYLAFHQDRYLYDEARTPAFEKDELLFWRLIPNNPKLGVNSQGFRGPEIVSAKSPDKIRIICLGCSVTFGVAEPVSYTTFLEQRLNQEAGAPRFEVLNLGVPGYSSFQGLRRLEQACNQYDPDYITWLFGWNDHWRHRGLPDRDQK
ncbi:MAG: SGNH/GDSL hydrolase family protein, partial [Planctomycetes bacterium]|nr:SGNH/GDSL hydrolase family protein [Planctomycetota bacterium]